MPKNKYATVRLNGPRSGTGWTVYRPLAAATRPKASSKHTNPAALVTGGRLVVAAALGRDEERHFLLLRWGLPHVDLSVADDEQAAVQRPVLFF